MSLVTGVGGVGSGAGVGGTSAGTEIGVLAATADGGAGRAVKRRTARYVTRHRTTVPMPTMDQNTTGLAAAVATGLGLLAGRPRVVDAEERPAAGPAALTTVGLPAGTTPLRSADDPSSSSSVSSNAPTV